MSSDIDESLDPGWAGLVREKFDTEHYNQAEYNWETGRYVDGVPTNIAHRKYICKHDGGWYWKYPAHEIPVRYDGMETVQDLTQYITTHHWHDPSVNPRDYTELLLKRYEENDGTDTMARTYLASQYLFNGDLDTALRYCEEEIAYDNPDKLMHALGYLLKGIALFHKGDRDGAEKCYTEAIPIEPRYRDSYVMLCTLYLEEGRIDMARNVARTALERTSNLYRMSLIDCWRKGNILERVSEMV